MAPPADRPETYTLSASSPCSVTACSTIDATDWASPDPRATSAGSNQLKHWLALLALFCSA